MKKLLSIALVVFMSIGVTSCSKSESKKDDIKETKSQTMVISSDVDAVGYQNLSDLFDVSDLVVVGVHTTDGIRQNEFLDANKNPYLHDVSESSFEISRILKGNLSVGDSINITQNYYIQNDDGVDTIYDASEMTPMKKSEKWVYFLSFDEINDTYWIRSIYGRYPVPTAENIKADELTAEEMGRYKKNDMVDSLYNELVEMYDWE